MAEQRPIRVQVEGHGIVEFPSGTSEDVMRSALSRLSRGEGIEQGTPKPYMGMGPDGQRRPMPTPQAQAPAAPPTTRTPGRYAVDVVKDLGGKFVDAAKSGARIAAEAVTDPQNLRTSNPLITSTARNVGAGVWQGVTDEAQKAREALERGDKAAFLGHAAAMTPVIGPMLDRWVQSIKNGKSEDVVSDLILFGLPMAASKLPGQIKITPSMRGMPAEEAAAVDWAQSQGVQLGAGTMTGSPLIRGAEQLAEKTSLIGGRVGASGRQAVNEGLATVSEQLASKTNPSNVPGVAGTAHTLETAGVDAANRALALVKNFKAQADKEFAPIHAAERANPAAWAVDVKATQDALRPLFQQLEVQAKGGPLRGSSLKAWNGLSKLMTAPNTLSFSGAFDILSNFKAALREAGESEPWSKGTSNLAQTVKVLDDQITNVARGAGGDAAVAALQRGRQATAKQYDVDAVREFLNGPNDLGASSVVKRLTAPKDANLQALRMVKSQVPDAMPQMARAYIEDLFGDAVGVDGSWARAFDRWQKTGKGTKYELFGDSLKKNPTLLRDIDNLMLAAKRSQMNVNTSGTAAQTANAVKLGVAAPMGLLNPSVWALTALQELGAGGLAKALQSPSVVRALTKGLSLPVRSASARASVGASINAALKAEGLPTLSFASTDKQKEER